MERFEEAIYRQREEINERMTEMFSLLKELTKGKSLEKVLVKEEVSNSITKYVNAISLVRTENDEGTKGDTIVDKNIDSTRWGKYIDRLLEMPRLQPIGYCIKHVINEKTIEGLVDNHKYNNSLLATRLGKMDNETYNSLPVGPMYNVILIKKLAKKYERGGIAEDMLIDVAGFVYPVDFIILDIKEDECMPLILGTSFLTTIKAEIKFDKGRMAIKAENCKIIFVMTLEHPSKIEEKIERDLYPIIPANHVILDEESPEALRTFTWAILG
ncbi:CAAX amino terminal protease [Tanacetum coccineum]